MSLRTVQRQELVGLVSVLQKVSGTVLTLISPWSLLPSEVVQQKGLGTDTDAYKALWYSCPCAPNSSSSCSHGLSLVSVPVLESVTFSALCKGGK